LSKFIPLEVGTYKSKKKTNKISKKLIVHMKDIAIIFDMDGVIVDNHNFHFKALKAFSKKHGSELTDEEFKENINGRTINEVVEYIFRNKKLSNEEIKEYGEEKEAMYRKDYQDHIKPVEGLEDFLIQLKQNRIPIAVATSAPTVNVDFTLDYLGLRKYFDCIIDSTFVEKGKPDPQVYLITSEKLGIAPDKCIVFEDSVSGIKSGKNAGMKVVALLTTHDNEEDLKEADKIVKNFIGLGLKELKDLIS
jgi:beta-phosphoglucomutase